MGFSKSKSSGSTSGSFDQNVWGTQGDALSGLYDQMSNLWNQFSQNINGQMGGIAGNIGDAANSMNPYWQQQMQGGAYSGVDAGAYQKQLNDYMNGTTASQDLYNGIMNGTGNAYVGGMQDQVMNTANKANMQAQSNLDARAAASGMSGGSRHGIASGQTSSDIYKNAQDQMTNIGYNSFAQDLNNKLNIAGMADANKLQALQMQGNMVDAKQNAMQGGLNFGQNMQGAYMNQFSPYMMPWQGAGMYANILGRPTILGSGNSMGSQSGKSKGMSF